MARWENWYTTGNFGQERLWGSSVVTRLDSESIFQQQFGLCLGDDGCYLIYFDSSTIVRLSGLLWSLEWPYLGFLVYYSAKTSRHKQNGLSYVPKKILTWMLRVAREGLKATVDNRVTTGLSLCPHNFLFFSVSFNQSLVFPGVGHCGPKPGWGLKNIFKFV